MSIELMFVLILIALLSALAFIYLNLKKYLISLQQPQTDPTLIEWLKNSQSDLNHLRQTLTSTLQQSDKNVTDTLQKSYQELNSRLDKAASVISELKSETGKFSEIGRNMQELQEFLKSPKLRGNIGEQVLKDLISQMFPKNSFNLQYTFKSGVIVDAAIKTDAGILPIDSKFPMENFHKMLKADSDSSRATHRAAFIRDVRKHVRDISTKYILPGEGTMDFALMYIPSESVYYEIAAEPEILDYARENRVYPVSPTTLYAHLQTILLSFEGKKIEEKSKQVFQLLRSLSGDYQKLDSSLSVLNRHLGNAYNQLNTTSQAANQIGQKLDSVKSLSSSSED